MYQRATLSDFLGERIVYRNLIPQDPALRDEMAAKGLQQAARFTWDRAARQLLKVLSDLTPDSG